MTWRTARLEEVAEVGSGAGFPIAEQGRSDGPLPFLKVSDMNLRGNARTIETWNNTVTEEVRARLRATAFPEGAVIFPKIGAAIATNKKRLLTRPCCVDNNVMAIVPNPKHIESLYLYYLLLKKDLSEFASDSNPPSIRKTVVEAWQIPVPPIDEQRRIVDLLSRAEGIVRLRREAQKKAQAIIPALFLDMFGDPETNASGYPVVLLSEVARVISGVAKGRQLDPAEVIERPYLRVANVKDGYLDLQEVKNIAIRAAELPRLKIEPGDLLMTEGGDPDKLGRAALWRGEIAECVHQNHVFKVRSDRACLEPIYLRALAGSSYGKGYFLRIAKRTTGIASINKTQLSAFPIVLPPLEMQIAFARHVDAVESIADSQMSALSKATASFNALLARTFRNPDDSCSSVQIEYLEAAS